LLKSLDHFKRAVDLDPAYTMAYCGISAAYNVMAGYCVVHPRTGLQKSMEAVQKALEIDPNSGEAHGQYAMNLWELNQAVTEAEREFRKALDLSPNSAHTMSSFVEMLTDLARFDEASQLTERELGLDPLGWTANMLRITLALYTNNIEVAELLTYQMLDIESDFLPMLRMHCQVLTAKGDLGKASTVAAKALEIAGEHPMYVSQLGYVSGLSGNHTAAVECLDRLEALQAGRFVPSYERALIHLGMENCDEALGELENGVEEGYCRILTINVDPMFGPLKETPRFREIVKRLNLV
jgi:tetratricopeptide (TPR) repeat protein